MLDSEANYRHHACFITADAMFKEIIILQGEKGKLGPHGPPGKAGTPVRNFTK